MIDLPGYNFVLFKKEDTPKDREEKLNILKDILANLILKLKDVDVSGNGGVAGGGSGYLPGFCSINESILPGSNWAPIGKFAGTNLLDWEGNFSSVGYYHEWSKFVNSKYDGSLLKIIIPFMTEDITATHYVNFEIGHVARGNGDVFDVAMATVDTGNIACLTDNTKLNFASYTNFNPGWNPSEKLNIRLKRKAVIGGETEASGWVYVFGLSIGYV